MKIIKFDLPINGIKAKNMEELRDNLTDEIVGLARSGQLARWFTSRQLEDKAKAVAAAVPSAPEDKALFLALCEVLEVEVHPDDVNAIFDAAEDTGILIKGARYSQLIGAQKTFVEELMGDVEYHINDFNVDNENESEQALVKIVTTTITTTEIVRFENPNPYAKNQIIKQIFVSEGQSVPKKSLLVEINGARSASTVSSDESGIINKIFIEENQVVKNNQILMTIKRKETKITKFVQNDA